MQLPQLWIQPRSRGLEPNYGSASPDPSLRHNRWAHLVGDVAATAANANNARTAAPKVDHDLGPPVSVNQDVNIFVAEVDGAMSLPFELRSKRQAYLVCLEGSLSLKHHGGCETLRAHDAAEAGGEQRLEVSAEPGGAHCLVVEMAASFYDLS